MKEEGKKTIRIAICDDQGPVRSYVKSKLLTYETLRNVNYIIDEYPSGDMLRSIHPKTQILLLDIDLV